MTESGPTPSFLTPTWPATCAAAIASSSTAGAKPWLDHIPGSPKTGEEAQFERRLDDRHIELTLRGQEKFVFLASQELSEKLGPRGGQTRRGLDRQRAPWDGYDALPPADGLSHYKYLVREPRPDIDVQRDIGCPPPCIQETVEHVRMEIDRPRREPRLSACAVVRCASWPGSAVPAKLSPSRPSALEFTAR